MPNRKQQPTTAQLAQKAGIAPTPLLHAYLVVFDSFAADTKEVATALNVDSKRALKMLRRLEEAGLVVGEEQHDIGGAVFGVTDPGRRDRLRDALSDLLGSTASPALQFGVSVSGPGMGRARGAGRKFVPLTWQCLQTYDSINTEEAIALFAKEFPPVTIDKNHKPARKSRKKPPTSAEVIAKRDRKVTGGNVTPRAPRQSDGTPTAQQIATEAGIDPRKFRRWLRANGRAISIDATYNAQLVKVFKGGGH